MKIRIGISIILVGIIHSIFGLVAFSGIISSVLSEGVFNTVNGQASREWAFWFLFFGFLLIIFGLLLDWCEKSGIELPRFLPWSLLIFTILLVVIMPVSGGWMMFIPCIGLFVRRYGSSKQNSGSV